MLTFYPRSLAMWIKSTIFADRNLKQKRMTKEIDPKLKLISDYLRIGIDEMFVIPEYQRGYSWTNLECDKLWQDIETFMASGEVNDNGQKEPYFFGTIIADCSEHNKISLIDGQQRTTTFILLLKALLIRLQEILAEIKPDEDNETLIDGLKDRRNKIIDILYKKNADNRREILKNWDAARGISILENRSINELREFKRELQVILEAEDFEEAECNCFKIPRRKYDNKYTNFFKNFKFFHDQLASYKESKVNSFAKAVLFECHIIEIRSWNTDQAITMFNSLNSTGMPLSDSDIISAQMYSNAGENKAPFMAKWEYITKIANNLSSRRIVNIDSVLQQYMYIWRAANKVYMIDGNLPDVTTPGLRRFYTSDVKSKNLLRNPMELCDNLEKIVRIWDRIKDYQFVRLMSKFNENIKIYLISYLFRFDESDITEEVVLEVGESLLKLFTILELVDAGFSSSRFKTFLFGEATKLVDKNIPIEEIRKDISDHISKNWEKYFIEGQILDYEKNILVYLNEYLYAKLHDRSFAIDETLNIEHIMPASGHNTETIRQDAGIETREEFQSLANKLGNKILLEEDINKSISNEWFKTKKQKSIKDKSGYKDSKYQIARALIDYPKDTWTKEDIETITVKIAERISKFIFEE